MSLNVSKAKAFIDNDQIKITGEDGIEYIVSQKRDNYNNTFWNVCAWGASAILLVSLFFFFIPLFGWETTFGRGAFFFFASIGSLITAVCCFCQKEDWKKISQNNTAEYNLAKHYLQPQIMELQKVLAKHKCEIINIEKEEKFNFKKKDSYQEMNAQ